MFSIKLLNNLRLTNTNTTTTNHTHLQTILKKYSGVATTEILQPVQLAYATYESTESPSDRDPSPLVIVHGLLGSKGNWNSLCKVYHQKTVPKRKIIAADARNHGDSPHNDNHSYEHLALDLKTLLRRLHINNATLLGHSMGGRAVMLFALKYPELVDKLIVVDISPVRTSPNLNSMPNLLNALCTAPLPKSIPMSTARMNVDQQLSKVITDKGLRSFLLTNLVQKPDGSYAWRVNLDVLKNKFDEIAKFPPVANATFEGPVLFVGGGSSDYIQKSDHTAIKKLFPNAEFKYIEGAGHWVHSEKPAEFLQVTIDFLNKVNAA